MNDTDQIHNRIELKVFRKNLRNNSTSAEATLWLKLKNSQQDGRKFRRQHRVGAYILDFYWPAEKLCIELDGADHYTGNGEAYDEERTKYLNSLNIRVIRFENKEVFQAIEYVLGRIYSCFNHP